MTEPAVNAPLRVLMIEDNRRLADLTSRYLASHNVEATIVADGVEGQAKAGRHNYDCVILDLMLPGKDGIDVCRGLRQRLAVPIIMVSARTEEVDRVLGLEVGADDYLTKPFSAPELLARIRAAVRRARGLVGPGNAVLDLGRLVLDPSRLSVTLDKDPVDVTSYEFAVLKALAERAGRVLSREQLLDLAKGSAELSFDRSIDVHISRLRAKLGDDARHPRLLKTIRGAGYLLALEPRAES